MQHPMHQPQLPGTESQPHDYTRQELDDLFGGVSHPALGGVLIAILMLAMAAI